MGGMKRQETTSSLRSSSSRRDSVSPATTMTTRHHVKTADVGCMSGIFHIMSKYHTRRKFLTFGKKQEKPSPSSPSPSPAPAPKPQPLTSPKRDTPTTTPKRLSLEAPRSPAIPPEIRTSTGSANSPRVVARLMGLEDMNVESPTKTSSQEEKRRKLLGALEKCDEDLKVLKNIIEAVRKTQTPPSKVVMEKRCMEEEIHDEELVESEEPSPVSVLDHHHNCARSSPLTGCSKRARNGQVLQQEQQQRIQSKQPRQLIIRKKPGEEDNASFYFLNRSPSVVFTTSQSLYVPPKNRQMLNPATRTSSVAWSNAMKETVTEVCRDVAWGQRREIGRIALLVQDFIYNDLVEEIIKEMGCCHIYTSLRSLPFEACKRKLSF